jgi:ketosteroid isomerase-like protein
MDDDAAAREQLLRRAYAAFNSRDIDGVLASMRPDVEWPNGMEGGYVFGHDQVRASFEKETKSYHLC